MILNVRPAEIVNPTNMINGLDSKTIARIPVAQLRKSWKKPFGELI